MAEFLNEDCAYYQYINTLSKKNEHLMPTMVEFQRDLIGEHANVREIGVIWQNKDMGGHKYVSFKYIVSQTYKPLNRF